MKSLPNQRALKAGQPIRVEHNAQIVKQLDENNPYCYEVEYPTGERAIVSLARINLINDRSRAVLDTDCSIQVFSPRLSNVGALDLLTWLETHKAELEASVSSENEPV